MGTTPKVHGGDSPWCSGEGVELKIKRLPVQIWTTVSLDISNINTIRKVSPHGISM